MSCHVETMASAIFAASASLPTLSARASASRRLSSLGMNGRSVRTCARDCPRWYASKLTFRQSYTFNDFHFVDNPTFKDNEIPSIPRNIYQGELRFSHDSGFYASINSRISGDYSADYNNQPSYKVDGYTIWGASIGYQDPKGVWSTYVTFNNISDKTYIVSTRPTVSTAANGTQGQGISAIRIGRRSAGKRQCRARQGGRGCR